MNFISFWKSKISKSYTVFPFTDFESAFREDGEYSNSKSLFAPMVLLIDLSDIYHSPTRPEQLDKVNRFSATIDNGKGLPPIKLLWNPSKGAGDGTHFSILDGRGRADTAETLGYKKIAAVVTETDPKSGVKQSGFTEYIKNIKTA
jgi:ParB-like nuclease family protein